MSPSKASSRERDEKTETENRVASGAEAEEEDVAPFNPDTNL